MNSQEIVQDYLNQIIDETHPFFTAITDENMIEDYKDHSVFTRDFLHKTKKKFRMTWRVYYGTPETVRTVFEPAIRL